MLERRNHVSEVERLLRANPVAALLGPRQVGKTTLARAVAAARSPARVTFFDLEDPRDTALLAEPMLALEPLRGLVVLDEIQRRPDLFPVLRVLADRPRRPATFLVLGSASPELLRQGSETLAGRVGFHELSGFSLAEVGADRLDRLWFRGGFPRAYLARSHEDGHRWRRDFLRTFVERDLPALGNTLPAPDMARFLAMLGHWHGQVWNGSEFGRSFGVSHTTVRRYLDLLVGAFVVRELRPFFENSGKRLVKAPKVYLADSGLLHTLLGLVRPAELLRHPRLGASWEGFVVAEVVAALGVRWDDCFFWATHAGAELDLLVLKNGQRLGFEVKRTDSPSVTASMRSARDTLRLDALTVVHAGARTFPLAEGVRALAARDLVAELG